jgi:hypothetical protein
MDIKIRVDRAVVPDTGEGAQETRTRVERSGCSAAPHDPGPVRVHEVCCVDHDGSAPTDGALGMVSCPVLSDALPRAQRSLEPQLVAPVAPGVGVVVLEA